MNSVKKLAAMHSRFGAYSGICKDCIHLRRVVPTSRVCYKCELYGNTSSEATDWRLSWLACGQYNKPVNMDNWTPLIEVLKRSPRPKDTELEGQIKI